LTSLPGLVFVISDFNPRTMITTPKQRQHNLWFSATPKCASF
jgi:hypothetical protein